MSSINLLPEDLKKGNQKISKKGSRFYLYENEFTKCEKLKKYTLYSNIKEKRFKKMF